MLSNDAKATRFQIDDIKLYFPFETLSTHDNAKLLQHLKSGFKSAKPMFSLLNWSKFSVNRLFALLFENITDRTVHTKYYLLTV